MMNSTSGTIECEGESLQHQQLDGPFNVLTAPDLTSFEPYSVRSLEVRNLT